MLSKCTVTGPFNRPDGKPFANARLTFKLSGRDREDDTIVMPSPVSVTTDADGDFSVELWPNSEGYAGTSYMASVVGYPQFRVVVPDVPTAKLALIMDLVPPPSVDDAQAAVDAARDAAADARADAEQTAEDRVATGQDRMATAADRVATGEDRSAAAADAGSAAGSATAADASAVSAAGSAGAAAGAASAASSSEVNATGSASAAAGSASAAAGSATTATNKAAEAVAARDVAVATTWVRFSPGPIYNDLGIPLGGYSCDLRAYRPSVQNRISGNIRQSGSGGSITFYYAVDDIMVAGPFTATVAVPVDEVVSYPVAIGKEVRMHVTANPGFLVKEFETASDGVIG